jgi:hypothetical protein
MRAVFITVYLMMMSVALDYVALNDWIIVNNKFVMMRKKVERTNLRYYPDICLETEKNHDKSQT